jgi:hypothetical protein
LTKARPKVIEKVVRHLELIVSLLIFEVSG